MCSNVDLCADYLSLHNSVRACGTVQRIRMCLHSDKQSYNAYIVFVDCKSAEAACSTLHDSSIFGNKLKAKVMNIDNVSEEEFDYIPKLEASKRILQRKRPILHWHVAGFKEGKENYILASECIESKVGRIPQGNMKRYGNKILIKAGNETQASLLTNFLPPKEGNISSITPHNSFNTSRGVVYSKDLYELHLDEILKRCPEDVHDVRKLKGTNNAILMTFSKTYVPEYIMINHSRIKVKTFLQRPKQCFKCFNYGHVSASCSNLVRCYVCSGEFNPSHECNNIRYCFNCEGSHSPNSKQCPRYRLEQEILEVAHNEKISLGSAKRKIMGANRTSDSSYASIISKIKRPNNASNKTGKAPKKNNANQSVATGSTVTAKVVNNRQESFRKTGTLSESPSSSSLGNKEIPPRSNKREASRKQAVSTENIKVTANYRESLKRPGTLSRSLSCGSLYDKDTTPTKLDTKASRKEAEFTNMENNPPLPKSTSKMDDDGFTVPSSKKRARPTSPTKNKDIEITNQFSSLEENLEVLQDRPEQKRLAIEQRPEEITKMPSVRTKTRSEEKSKIGGLTTAETDIQREPQGPSSDDNLQTLSAPKPSRVPRLNTGNNPGPVLNSKININK